MSSYAADSESGVLSDLQSPVISPSTDLVSPANLDTASAYIQHSKDTLTRLILGDGYLSSSGLETLVGAFAYRPVESGLNMLYVKAVSLNPQLFDLLAEKLPGLDDLDVTFNGLLADVKDEGTFPVDVKPLEELDTEALLGQISRRIYSHWLLYGLWIWQHSHMAPKTVYEILDAPKRSIPLVKDG